jgi:hypothetical protein
MKLYEITKSNKLFIAMFQITLDYEKEFLSLKSEFDIHYPYNDYWLQLLDKEMSMLIRNIDASLALANYYLNLTDRDVARLIRLDKEYKKLLQRMVDQIRQL